MKPLIAIVGRPNVGKSSLFNRIVGRRKAIVNNRVGVTRDRHYADAEWDGCVFGLIDTGGIADGDGKSVQSAIKRQTLAAIKEAGAVICLFDGREGLNEMDKQVVSLLRKAGKTVFYVVNKMEGADMSLMTPFYELGLSGLIPISAEHGRNTDELLDAVVCHLKKAGGSKEALSENPADASAHHIAIIGRPNAGKSSLINRLFGSERVIVHEIPGTTRDSIDVEIEAGGKKYMFVDTAGLKKKGKTIETLDKYSAIKTLASIERAKIALLMVDSNEGFTHQDSFLLDHAYSAGKAVIVLLNKWDALKTNAKELKEFYEEKLLRLHDVPFLCISAKTGENIEFLFPEIDRIVAGLEKKLTTSELNKLLADAQASHSVPGWRGKSVKFYYATQVNTNPPAFIIFANHPEGVGSSYKKYLLNRIRELIGRGVPVKIVFKRK